MLLIAAILCLTAAGVLGQECPIAEQILPCVCSKNVVSKELNLDCSNATNSLQLQNVFEAPFPTKDFKEFTMRGYPWDIIPLGYLPDGLFGEVTFQTIYIDYTELYRIGDNIFEPSYHRLEVIRIMHSKLGSFPTITLPNMTHLNFLDVSHNNIAFIPDLHSNSLEILYLENNKGLMFSENLFKQVPQLYEVNLDNCALKSVTQNLFSYNGHLHTVYMQLDNITYLETGALTFTNNSVSRINLSNNNINDVDVGFISGTSGRETIFLMNNQITELEEAVWYEIFYILSIEDEGSVFLDGNPLKCDCSIAWLVTSPNLLKYLNIGATCDDGTAVHSLDPDDFSDC